MQQNYTRISPARFGEDGLVQSVEKALEEIVEVGTVGKTCWEFVWWEKESDFQSARFLDLWEIARLSDDCSGLNGRRSDLTPYFQVAIGYARIK
jgi:hypothetical protein